MDSWDSHHLSRHVSNSCGACPVPSSPTLPWPLTQFILLLAPTAIFHHPAGLSSTHLPKGLLLPLHLSPSCSSCWNWICWFYFWILSIGLSWTRQLASSAGLAFLWPLMSIVEILLRQVESYCQQPRSLMDPPPHHLPHCGTETQNFQGHEDFITILYP